MKASEVDGVGIAGRLKILHVYRGSIDVDYFEAVSLKALPAFGRYYIYPEFQEGELGIWVIQRDAAGNWAPSKSYGAYNMPFELGEARMIEGDRGHKQNYYIAQNLSELSEEIFNCDTGGDRETQLNRLREISQKGSVVEAVWAIREIKTGKFPVDEIHASYEALMDGLSGREVSVQLLLDEIFCELDLQDWKDSDRRKELLLDWIANLRSYSRTEMKRVQGRLYLSWQKKELSEDVVFQLFWASLEVHDKIKRDSVDLAP